MGANLSVLNLAIVKIKEIHGLRCYCAPAVEDLKVLAESESFSISKEDDAQQCVVRKS